jgi:hypothetical protein
VLAVDVQGGGPSVTVGGVEEDLTTSVVVAIWVAHNSNLIFRRGRRSDVDGRQSDAILISDQVKQKTAVAD